MSTSSEQDRSSTLYSEIIYDDSFATEFVMNSWNDPAVSEQSQTVYRGKLAFNVTLNAWNAFGVARRTEDWNTIYPMYPNQYKKISFYYNPGNSVEDDISNVLTLNKDTTVKLVDYLEGSSFQADSWHKVVIPVEDMDSLGEDFFEYLIFNNSNQESQFYVDDFSILWCDDFQAPILSNVECEIGIYNDSVTISWESDERSSVVIDWGIDTLDHHIVYNLDNSDSTLDYVLGGEVEIEGLSPEQQYQFRIIASDHQRNDSHSPNQGVYSDSFITGPRDETPPVLSGLAVEDIHYYGATFTWESDELSSSVVHWGSSESDLNQTTESAQGLFVQNHEVQVSAMSSNSTYFYQVESSDPAGNTSQSAVYSFLTSDINNETPTLSFHVDTASHNKPISPYIYGMNYHGSDNWSTANYTLGRLGGNRWTAYNWETNASNAGSDWYHSSDSFLGGGDVPAAAITDRVDDILGTSGQAALVTIPILGYVSADKNGAVDPDVPNYLDLRFHENLPFKGTSLSLSPNIYDDFVYQDEMVHYLETYFGGQTIFYSLDNEPALWASTHALIHPNAVSYDELINLSIQSARAVKSINPQAPVLGFVAYGYNAFINLQDAPDASSYSGTFIDNFLNQFAEAESDYGLRLLDVLDLHWYPEARGINNSGTSLRITVANADPAMAEARMQAPRSLWDPSYTENSWIAQYATNGPIELLPWVQAKVDSQYPGTKISISEYYYGGGNHISGAIAQADVLGIYGREGIFAATTWPDDYNREAFMHAAFNMYLNYDGQGASFGDTSVEALSDDYEKSSIYASLDSTDPDRLVLLVINKTSTFQTAEINLTDAGSFTQFSSYVLNAESPEIHSRLQNASISSNHFLFAMEPYSVSTLLLRR